MLKKLHNFIFNPERKYTFLELYSFGFAFIALGFSVAAFSINFHVDWHKDWVDVAKVVTSLLILASIIMAIINYRYIKKWNQQKAAIDALHSSKILLKKHIQKLDKEINIQDKLIHNKVLTIQELHNLIGVFMEDGSFIFHGEHSDNHIDCVHTRNNGFIKEFKEKSKGRKIYVAIEEILNEYEYLCMAANQGIFYRKTLIELRGSGIVRIFNLFSNHIYHLRYDKRHGFGPRLYSHLENFANEIGELLGLEVSKPKKNEYSSTFEKKADEKD